MFNYHNTSSKTSANYCIELGMSLSPVKKMSKLLLPYTYENQKYWEHLDADVPLSI